MAATETTNAPPRRRLLSVNELAAYLSLSYWQARELVIYGHIRRVSLPNPRAGDGRPMERLLVDLGDVDAWIERHKDRGEQA